MKKYDKIILAAFLAVAVSAIACAPVPVYAGKEVASYYADASSGGDAITSALGSYFKLLSVVLSSAGEIYLLWGISEWGVSFQTSDGGAASQAFKRIFGGILMCLAPQVVPLIL